MCKGLQVYLGYAVKGRADVYDVEALLVLCIDSKNLLGGRCINQPMVDHFWLWLLVICFGFVMRRLGQMMQIETLSKMTGLVHSRLTLRL